MPDRRGTAGDCLVNGSRLRQSVGGIVAQESMDLTVDALDLVETSLRYLVSRASRLASLAVRSEMVSWFNMEDQWLVYLFVRQGIMMLLPPGSKVSGLGNV